MFHHLRNLWRKEFFQVIVGFTLHPEVLLVLRFQSVPSRGTETVGGRRLPCHGATQDCRGGLRTGGPSDAAAGSFTSWLVSVADRPGKSGNPFSLTVLGRQLYSKVVAASDTPPGRPSRHFPNVKDVGMKCEKGRHCSRAPEI